MNKYDVLIDAQHFDKVSEALRTSEKANKIFVLKTSDDPIKLEFDLSDINVMAKKTITLDVPISICEDMKMTMTYASAYLRATQNEGLIGIVGRSIELLDTTNIVSNLINNALKPPSTLRIFTDREGMADIAHDIFEEYTDISLISSSDEMPKETRGMRGPNMGPVSGSVANLLGMGGGMGTTEQNIMQRMHNVMMHNYSNLQN